MIDYFKQVLTAQFEASLSMLNDCIKSCPEEHWDGRIATVTFKQVAYHTLFYVDLYLTRNEESFQLRDFHTPGGDERNPFPSPGLSRDVTLSYVQICRQKMIDSIASETSESLAGPSGFSWYKVTRGEMHLINIRHIQHHTGQLSAFLRRMDERFQDRESLRWVGSGWRES
jgi:uncharacterized damage-inducible protein DinB